MKPRASAGAVPLGLLVFDGREFATAADWTEAYEAWVDARDQWESEHPGLLLPEKRLLSGCPFDPDSI